MAAKRGAARVVFDELAFNDDLGRTSEHGRRIAVDTRSAYEQHGCPVDDLLACQEQATDGTDLPGCAKVYLPAPRSSRWIYGARSPPHPEGESKLASFPTTPGPAIRPDGP
jgi:hypothetical protein